MAGLEKLNAELYEIKHYELRIDKEKQAYIQILCFEDGKFGNQAKIYNESALQKYVSSKIKYDDIEKALSDVMMLIAAELAEDREIRNKMFG